MKHFAGRVAFVTGGASGIGYGLVRNFLREGMKVVVIDWNADHLEEVRGELAGRSDVHFVRADVADREQVRAAAAEAVRAFGKIHTTPG
jgi:NAD(P)-dependent dehydrogenase (short-subunit alcohol dehydrogenase family)